MKEFWNKAIRDRAFVLGAAALLVLILIAVFGESMLYDDPYQENFSEILRAPSSRYIFGTDAIGRSIFSRVVAGAKYSLLAAFLMAFFTAFIGTAFGLIAGYAGGAADSLIMRLCDILLSLPTTVCAIAAIAVIGPGLGHLVLILSLLWWTKYARLTRNLIFKIKGSEYITEAQLGGETDLAIITRYILPNVLPEIIVMCALDMGKMLLTIAGMSYLGLSAQPPVPEWGYMLSEGRRYIQSAPWMIMFPGAAIFIAVLCFNILGDAIRDIMDPKYKSKRKKRNANEENTFHPSSPAAHGELAGRMRQR
ncbi:MAG: ABC transporter permease [Eubacteriaceae bacterium]|nr:ABC transporter permease [Eubacteriaceae bacterium]